MEEIYVFGDQTEGCHASFKDIFTRKNYVLLQSFLDQANLAIRSEIRRRCHTYHKAPAFSTIQELVDLYHQDERKDPALESALTSISQFSHLIAYFEEKDIAYFPTHAHISIIGVCTGLITAAAVTSASSLTALIPLAVEAVKLSFRVGAYVARVAHNICVNLDSQMWSTVVAGDQITIRRALDDFHTKHKHLTTSRIWISASTSTSVTISGPPSIRTRFLADLSSFSGQRSWSVPIYGPYHATHLYTNSDIETIILPETKEVFGSANANLVICSTTTGQPIPGNTPLDVLRNVLREILIQPINLTSLIEHCTSTSAKSTKVYTIGATSLASSLATQLRANAIDVGMVNISGGSSVSQLEMQTRRTTDIAIVGMSGRFPDAADHELFWQLLEKGLDVHRPIPPDRYPVQSHTDSSKKKRNTSHTPYGNFIEHPGLFDARFFNMSPREAAQTDPMQRLMLTTAYEAMEMGGIVPGRTPSTKHNRIGTFYGQTSDDWREVNAAQDIDTYFISGGVRAFGPGRLNYFFKFSGPSFSVDTACSSSFAAMHVAITSLRAGECDTAITGGANVLTNPDIFAGLSRGHFLSPTGSCKTFDNDADGYCRGDGVCTVIFKRLHDALEDKDPILGVIRGIGTNHSAQAVSITHPCTENQAFLFNKIMKECNVDCKDVNYVEMHGTGTQAGDSIEMESVSSIFAPRDPKRRPDQPLFVGAVKSNIGHGEAVSGVSSLIKVLLMLQKDKIPPHVGIKQSINRSFPPDLHERGLHIAVNATAFRRPKAGKRLIFINNFSAAGGNTAMLLEDGPGLESRSGCCTRSTYVVTVSAKSQISFKNNVNRMLAFVANNRATNLADLAYTTSARRLHYAYRAALPVDSIDALIIALRDLQGADRVPLSINSPNLCFVFTGQGSQYPTMGRHLYDTCAQFRSDLDDFDAICVSFDFPSFKSLIQGTGSIDDMSSTVVQLGMSCIQMALARLWATWGIRPSVVIGHSLGEYAALQVAGVLTIADTIFLVGTRAVLLESKCSPSTHAMLAVRCSVSELQSFMAMNAGIAEIACINGPADTVLSGPKDIINHIAQQAVDAGIKCTKLSIPYAFHSSQIDPILADFGSLAESVTYHPPQIPVISTLLNEVVCTGGVFNSSYLTRHCREKVNIAGGLSAAVSKSTISTTSVWIEIGAHPLCSSMLRACLSTSVLPTLRRDEDPWKTISTSLAALYEVGVAVDWNAFHEQGKNLVCLNSLPFYGFDEKRFWLQYTGDWLLYKGDYPGGGTTEPQSQPKAALPRKYLSTAVQAIVSEEVNDLRASVVAQSDLADSKLWPVIKGHLVNGVALCPSSLYADQALTLAEYAYKLLRPGEAVYCNIGGMENPAPLTLKSIETPVSQTMTMICEVDLKHRTANFKITSNNGYEDILHAKCVIKFEDVAAWKEEWNRNAYLVKSRIDLLKRKTESGEADQLSRKMAYKLFTALVDYSDTFQGMHSVIFDGSEFEATSSVRFRCTTDDGKFLYNPFCIDSTAHLSGFTVNATVNAQEECYISHGWSSLRILEPFKYDRPYSAYVKMQLAPGSKMRVGDVWIFDEKDEVVGLVGGLRFQCIPRKLMDVMMPKAKSAATLAPTARSTKLGLYAHKPGHNLSKPSKMVRKSREEQRASKPKSIDPTRSPAKDTFAKIFEIIASEIAVEQSELIEETRWADIGVDSLMSLSICGKLREELSMDIESTAFMTHASVGAFRKHMSVLLQISETVVDIATDSSRSSDHDSASDSETTDSAITTPDSEDFEVSALKKAPLKPGIHKSERSTSSKSNEVEILRKVIAEEMEVNPEEVTDSTDLRQLGMDSLMALTVLGRLREDHDIDLDPTIFSNATSLSRLRGALGHSVSATTTMSAYEESSSADDSSVGSHDVLDTMPEATSVLLSGNAKSATKNLFLFPDGSGSATSYASIPALSDPKLAVFGLNCPFMKNPTHYTCGIEGVSKLYLREVLRRQPIGPWILGGWSAGGVVAYEVTRQIASMAKKNGKKNTYVEALILIDSPCPVRLEPLPARLHHFFDEIGLLGSGPSKAPDWLLPHFEYSIKALTAYQPELKSKRDFRAPPTLLIWATEGVCGEPDSPRPPPQADDPKSMKWLLENRTDFGPNGWDQLLGLENCTMVKVVGNHFTMMKPPVAQQLAQIISQALASTLS